MRVCRSACMSCRHANSSDSGDAWAVRDVRHWVGKCHDELEPRRKPALMSRTAHPPFQLVAAGCAGQTLSREKLRHAVVIPSRDTSSQLLSYWGLPAISKVAGTLASPLCTIEPCLVSICPWRCTGQTDLQHACVTVPLNVLLLMHMPCGMGPPRRKRRLVMHSHLVVPSLLAASLDALDYFDSQ